MKLLPKTQGANPTPVLVVSKSDLEATVAKLDEREREWTMGTDFQAGLGQICLIPALNGRISKVLFGFGTAQQRKRERFSISTLAGALPKGSYSLSGDYGDPDEAALAWLLAGYNFNKYNEKKDKAADLVVPDTVDLERVNCIAEAASLAQDLINTPANDMGPDALERAFRALAAEHNGEIAVIRGEDLLSRNFPMIHAVGRASDQEPRLLELNWGPEDAPKITLVGKGVCFDTGGLNIKPGSSMALMKKDMGGAANAMALAKMIMTMGLSVRLKLLVPAVENSISQGAFRPGDILHSRKGLTVEINNTDAEGRLVLADALAYADEGQAEQIYCFATLTGAARVALGPDVSPFYTDQDELAAKLGAGAEKARDPLWRMPFWDPYEELLEPGIADLDNAPSGGFAGSITAALFLRRFVTEAPNFAHFDIYGWTPAAKPGRPKGGACQAVRAVFEVLEATYSAQT